MALATGSRLGPYEILARIGAGGMGEVYRARDSRLKRDVALKVLPEAFSRDAGRMARFEREAQLLASLNHPNIASLYGLEDSGGLRALIMELVEGPTLAERISEGPIALDEALPIARQIAEALEEAHEKTIIHRDLKPANVKVTPDGKVKVLDFGLAKALEDDPGEADQAHSPTMSLAATRAGMLLGTAGYMSPEQAKGKRVDRRADIWAFGIVLLEMLTGRSAYSGETVAETLAFVMTKEAPLDALPPATPPAIRKLLRRCLEKDPKRRLQAIGEARLMIDEVLQGTVEEVQPSAPRPPAPDLRPRRPAVWIGSTAALSAALAVLAFLHFRETPPPAEPVRFQIPAPEKSGFRGGPLISPDGRRVVFSATASGGRNLLWVRPLGSLEAQPLPGTDDAAWQFWSPDSRFIGFWAGGKLKKVEASGGPPQSLCDASQFSNGGWGRQGVIVFGSFRTGLSRVSSSGGPVTALTTLDTGRQETGHLYPHFLPDGRHFLYFIRANQENQGIYLGSTDAKPDSKERRRLLGADSHAAYVPAQGSGPGHLLFLRESTLMAQVFDAEKLQLAGEPFPVAEQVGSQFDFGFFSASDSGLLVYRSGGGQHTQLAWYDREGKQLGAAGTPGMYSGLTLSPDGKQVALQQTDRQSDNQDIWLLDLARNIPARFTFHPAPDGLPVWSPDGDRIVFYSLRDGPSNLYQKVSSGAGNEEPLLKSAESKYPHDWSRDGRFLIYSSFEPKTASDLWVLPLSGDRKPELYLQTEFNESHAQFSPDGRWVAYVSTDSPRTQVYVQPFPRSGGKWLVSSEGGSQPRWRGDGRELFYIAPDRKLMSVEIRTASKFEATVPRALFQTRILATLTRTSHHYAVSADGKRFLIISTMEETASAPITVVMNWMAALKK